MIRRSANLLVGRKVLAPCLLVVIALATLTFAPPAWATTFTVDRNDDPDPTVASACTAATNDCSMRGAIVAANASAGADTISVPAGTYTLTRTGARSGARKDQAATSGPTSTRTIRP